MATRSMAAMLLAGVLGTASAAPGMPLGQLDFATYQRDSLDWLQQHRAFQGPDQGTEVRLNAPRERRPTGRPQRGILLVHGLGDSPWSFEDIGPLLAARGFLVSTLLLPGHGTRPEDLLEVQWEDWERVVRERATILKGEVGELFLGGFSTGTNLVLDYAYEDHDVAGLVMFSPAFQSDSAYDWLTPLISWARPRLLQPYGVRPMQNLVRYMTVLTDSACGLRGKPIPWPPRYCPCRVPDVLSKRLLCDPFGTEYQGGQGCNQHSTQPGSGSFVSSDFGRRMN